MDPFKHVQHEDDVLETALNAGVAFAAKKYGVYESVVIQIVRRFQGDIEDECSCEKAARLGLGHPECLFCFGKRINL